jgi:ribosomal protein S18 acetylase RimI-like enzyme
VRSKTFVSFAVFANREGREAMITIKKIATAEQDAAVSAIVKAFSADPAARWIYPDSQEYSEHFQSFVKAFGGAAFEHGSADLVDGYLAAALWLPPGIHPDEEAMGKLIQGTVAEGDQANVFALFEQMDRYHPAEPHWYLTMIGVDAAQQRKGYGSALLQHGLARIDREDNLAYLEATNPSSVRLYQRHGFGCSARFRSAPRRSCFRCYESRGQCGVARKQIYRGIIHHQDRSSHEYRSIFAVCACRDLLRHLVY